ncbi:uncharacterized protein LOC9638845 [Selaginella moellendorffii]|uniref:uncharacterized protein LOC9638845 n=1 Tax=Selaginella moellendorffii TaxID=88036 RepID=UPI000D1CECC8|nr:uncharacterized protein LOC9638845 [Selaginella moellendorffii]|eukprot:XP_024523212.1 uncharacterized protein LOC9638845 [Selaginella moellendorffii]
MVTRLTFMVISTNTTSRRTSGSLSPVQTLLPEKRSPGGCVEKLALQFWYDVFFRTSLDFGSDLWRLDLNTNVWREQLQLKGCPGARSGHRLKHKLILFGGFYDTLREERYFNNL